MERFQYRKSAYENSKGANSFSHKMISFIWIWFVGFKQFGRNSWFWNERLGGFLPVKDVIYFQVRDLDLLGVQTRWCVVFECNWRHNTTPTCSTRSVLLLQTELPWNKCRVSEKRSKIHEVEHIWQPKSVGKKKQSVKRNEERR